MSVSDNTENVIVLHASAKALLTIRVTSLDDERMVTLNLWPYEAQTYGPFEDHDDAMGAAYGVAQHYGLPVEPPRSRWLVESPIPAKHEAEGGGGYWLLCPCTYCRGRAEADTAERRAAQATE